MNHVNLFFNYKLVNKNYNKPNRVTAHTLAFGNWCFKPMRYFFKGGVVELYYYSSPNHALKKLDYNRDYQIEDRTWMQTITKTILLIPGLMLGTIAKGLAYTSPTVRQPHRTTVRFYARLNKQQEDPKLHGYIIHINNQGIIVRTIPRNKWAYVI